MRLSECSIPWFYSTLENNSDNNNKQPCTGLFLKQAGSNFRRGKESSPSPLLLLSSCQKAEMQVIALSPVSSVLGQDPLPLSITWRHKAWVGNCLAANSGLSGCISCSIFLLCALDQSVHPQLGSDVRYKQGFDSSRQIQQGVSESRCAFWRKEGKKQGCKTTQVFTLYSFQLLPVEKAAGIALCKSMVVVAITTFHSSEVRWRWWFVRLFPFKLCWIILKTSPCRLLSA